MLLRTLAAGSSQQDVQNLRQDLHVKQPVNTLIYKLTSLHPSPGTPNSTQSRPKPLNLNQTPQTPKPNPQSPNI